MTSFRNNNTNIPQILSNEEFEASKDLSTTHNLIIQKADKGNSVVLVAKNVYIRHIEKILDDVTKFEKIEIKKGILNFSINHEISLTTDQYKKIKVIGRRARSLYGFCKVRKAVSVISVHFKPIISAIGTPSYKLAKLLVPKLSLVTFNEFTVKGSFAFAEEIVNQDGKPLVNLMFTHFLLT